MILTYIPFLKTNGLTLNCIFCSLNLTFNIFTLSKTSINCIVYVQLSSYLLCQDIIYIYAINISKIFEYLIFWKYRISLWTNIIYSIPKTLLYSMEIIIHISIVPWICSYKPSEIPKRWYLKIVRDDRRIVFLTLGSRQNRNGNRLAFFNITKNYLSVAGSFTFEIVYPHFLIYLKFPLNSTICLLYAQLRVIEMQINYCIIIYNFV